MNIFYSAFLGTWVAFNGNVVAFGDTMDQSLGGALSKIMPL